MICVLPGIWAVSRKLSTDQQKRPNPPETSTRPRSLRPLGDFVRLEGTQTKAETAAAQSGAGEDVAPRRMTVNRCQEAAQVTLLRGSLDTPFRLLTFLVDNRRRESSSVAIQQGGATIGTPGTCPSQERIVALVL